MKLTSQEMREKVIELLKLKGELATMSIVNQLDWMASSSKIRDIITSLQHEGIVESRQTAQNGKMSYMWKLVDVPVKQVKPELPAGVSTFDSEALAKVQEKPELSAGVVNTGTMSEAAKKALESMVVRPAYPEDISEPLPDSIDRSKQTIMDVKTNDRGISAMKDNLLVKQTMRHELEIILRKQQRRREWAGKILQNSEATIKYIEQQIKDLS